jgi:threonine aldolase
MLEEGLIDLRSDTVTLPTDEMLEEIKHARLGDDVFKEDPTVNLLEEMAAEKMGKEAALLVPSGTQANLVSLMTNCKRGELVILDSESHIYWYEVGGMSVVAALFPWPQKSEYGFLNPSTLEEAVRLENIHFPKPALICIENTHNRYGGTIISPDQIKAIYEFAQKHALSLYMDGARIFNAAVSLRINVKEFTQHVDNLMFSLSKGLCCPVGSVLAGTSSFIERARKNRKLLGGGMRQAGVLAAPGIIALQKMVDRLSEDHENARLLAEGIRRISEIKVNLYTVQTNIVCFDVNSSDITVDVFLAMLREEKILALSQGRNTIRMVTHQGIKREHIERVIAAVETIFRK